LGLLEGVAAVQPKKKVPIALVGHGFDHFLGEIFGHVA